MAPVIEPTQAPRANPVSVVDPLIAPVIVPTIDPPEIHGITFHIHSSCNTYQVFDVMSSANSEFPFRIHFLFYHQTTKTKKSGEEEEEKKKKKKDTESNDASDGSH